MMVTQTSNRSSEEKSKGLMGRLRNSASLIGEWRRFQKSEDGSMIVFTLFIFVLMLLVGGMAVDLMRFETKRAKLQNSLDSATLAAANMNSTANPTQLVKDFMAKNGYDPAKVNVPPPQEVWVGADPANNIQGTLAARSVTANYDLDMNTIFMHMMGIDSLGTGTRGGAAQGVQAVEISLVVDISGSMGGQKMTDLKSAATNFFNQVIDPQRTEAVTSISVIPYNHTTVVPDALLDRLATGQATTDVSRFVPIPVAQQATYNNGNPIPGALTQFPRTADGSKCVRFNASDYVVNDMEENLNIPNPNYLLMRSITPSTVLDKMQYYDPYDKSAGAGGSYDRPADDSNRRCDPTRAAILPLETNQQALITYINTLTTGGWTAVDHGMKWGVALLDPGMRPVINDMVNATPALLPQSVFGRPYDYDPAATMKVLVLMTDGANTSQYDVKTEFKNGPSRIWYSEMAANETGPNGEDWSSDYIVDNENGSGNQGSDGNKDRNKEWYDGYYVLMEDGSGNNYWMRPHWPGDKNDGSWHAITDLPADAVQQEYTELYDRFSERALAELFRDDSFGDWNARNAHRNAHSTVVDGTEANRRMNGTGTSEFGMCDIAKVKNDILVFTIAFQAGSTAESVMRECASGVNGAGYYFPASNGTALNNAFSAIAGQITKLRLTQ